MTGADGSVIPPAGQSFGGDFRTVAHWQDGLIVEENLFDDRMSGCREQARSNVYAVRLAPPASTGRSTLRVLAGVGRNARHPW